MQMERVNKKTGQVLRDPESTVTDTPRKNNPSKKSEFRKK